MAIDAVSGLTLMDCRRAAETVATADPLFEPMVAVIVEVPADEGDRAEWVQEVAMEVAEGILAQGFEPTPSFAACSMCDYRLVCPAAER